MESFVKNHSSRQLTTISSVVVGLYNNGNIMCSVVEAPVTRSRGNFFYHHSNRRLITRGAFQLLFFLNRRLDRSLFVFQKSTQANDSIVGRGITWKSPTTRFGHVSLFFRWLPATSNSFTRLLCCSTCRATCTTVALFDVNIYWCRKLRGRDRKLFKPLCRVGNFSNRFVV